MMSSYYRTINGQRYDADLLEMAEGLMEGHRDGRLSRADAEQLWEAAFDGMGMTAVEMATLAYIRAHENPTRPAKEFFDEMGVGKGDADSCLSQAGQIAAANGLEELRLMRFDIEEISEQEKLGGSVAFKDAFNIALAAVLEPTPDGPETPYNVLAHSDLDDLEVTNEVAMLERLRELLNLGTVFLVPLDTPPNPDASEDYYPPENGEKPQDNWIFNLYIDELSDHLYWMVVPRNGGEVTVYGFN